ncbi:outer membrane protein [uncultured Devosia sp.]|uniref:outer membrane protein n=1 Tax=uncultured Devosia sp. TaxID=211434 RepID=UPI00261210D5|nr:outer membrane protein [uncultured Devosia sp.]
MRHSAIALFALAAASTAAPAADLSWNSNSTSPIYGATSAAQWSGFYAGVSGGYAWGTTVINPALPAGQVNNNSAGWALGAQAGYNMDMGGFVIGGEADLQWASIGHSEPIAGGTFEAKTDFFGTARGRAGVTIGQVMPYATGGLAFGRGVAQESTGVVTSQTANHIGWTAGLGLEAQATSDISIKAEYLYVDLGSQAYAGLPTGNRDIAHRFSLVRAGINYKF